MRTRLLLASACAALLLAGCSSVKVWPFDNGSNNDRVAGKPANATEYQCDGGKRFYVRMLDSGNTAWVIYPDREVGLAKTTSATETRYSNGVAVLIVTGSEASLTDGTKIAYAGCRAATNK